MTDEPPIKRGPGRPPGSKPEVELAFHPAPLPQSDDLTVLTTEQYLAIAQAPTLAARLESLIELFATRIEDVVDPTWLTAWASYMRTHKSQIAEMVVKGATGGDHATL